MRTLIESIWKLGPLPGHPQVKFNTKKADEIDAAMPTQEAKILLGTFVDTCAIVDASPEAAIAAALHFLVHNCQILSQGESTPLVQDCMTIMAKLVALSQVTDEVFREAGLDPYDFSPADLAKAEEHFANLGKARDQGQPKGKGDPK